MKKLFTLSLAFCLATLLLAQPASKRVLFIGNSYTEANNLPSLIQQVAQSVGDDISYQSNTPGGCTFAQHCSNRSMDLIRQGGWDIVVLQEQSQYPSFPQSQVEAECLPFAARLVDSVRRYSPNATPMFFMTWGHKNGDAANARFFPVLGTYEGMDSMLCLRYMFMAQSNHASVCPVGRVWRYLRQHHPDIELYQSDGSHPSLAGSYAAACAFYAMFFQRSPLPVSFVPAIDTAHARIIRTVVDSVVFRNLSSWLFDADVDVPPVSLVVDAVTVTSISVTLSPSAACSSFSAYLSTADEMDYWTSLMQATPQQIVSQWGIRSSATLSHTFSDLVPATEHILYVLAHTIDGDTLLMFPVSTLAQGGHGTSHIDISVSNITTSSVRVHCAPNEHTVVFHDMLITRDAFDNYGADSVRAMLLSDPYPHYEAYDWDWLQLDSATDYYSVAIGQNVDSVWGDLSIFPFRTLGDLSVVVPPDAVTLFSLCPNPAVHAQPIVLNARCAGLLQLFDISGRQLLSLHVSSGTSSLTLPSTLLPGVYTLRLVPSSATLLPYATTLLLR